MIFNPEPIRQPWEFVRSPSKHRIADPFSVLEEATRGRFDSLLRNGQGVGDERLEVAAGR